MGSGCGQVKRKNKVFKDNKLKSDTSLAVGCALSCCSSCSFCLLTRASAKERIKSRSYSEQNKACRRCMLCKSMSFCPSCSQCPQCCHRTECRGKVTKVLASLARNGRKSSGNFCLEGGLHPSVQTETPFDKVSHSSEWLCKPSKEPVLKGSLTKSHEQVGSRKGGYQVDSGFLQPAFPCPQTKQKMETNLGPESVKLIPQYQYLQDGNSGDNPVILTDRGMGDVAGLQRRAFPHSNKSKVTKISEVFPVQSSLPIHSSSLWSGHTSLDFTKVVKEVKLMAQARGIRIHQYLDDWLLRAPCPETCLQHTRTLLALCQQLGWVVNMKTSELIPQQVFNFVGYRFDVVTGRVLPTHDRWTDNPPREVEVHKKPEELYGQAVYVSHRTVHSNEKQVWSSRLHMRPIQWHLKRHWHVPEVLEKVIPVPQALHPHLDWWLEESNVLRGQPLHPLQHALQLFTDASNEGWGAHLGDSTARGIWSAIERQSFWP